MPSRTHLQSLFLYAPASPLLASFIVFCVVSCGQQCFAQTPSLNPRSDSASTLNSLSFGTTKMASTFLFYGDADLRSRVLDGILTLKQLYRGSTIRSTTATFRDDEIFSMQYRATDANAIQPLFQADAQVSRDSRSIGLSSLTRFNAAAGVRLSPDSNRIVELQTGYESNKLLGILDNGGLLRAKAQISNLDVDQFRLRSTLQSEFTIFPRRTNGDVDAAVQLNRVFDDFNSLGLNVSYRTLNREWYTQILSDTSLNTLVETRLEQRLNLEGHLLFGISTHLSAEVLTSISSASVDRAFKDALTSAPSTSAERSLSELQFNVTSTLNYRSNSQQHTLSLVYVSRDEQNTAQRHFAALNNTQLDTLQEQERVRDNSTWRTLWSLRSAWNLSRRDTLSLTGSFSLLRYDTQSNANDDDRDELNSHFAVGFGRRFSDQFSASISTRVQMNHLVFIKAQRSALNAWNRILQFAPSADFISSFMQLHPRFEVLAQYTVYDFDGRAGVPSSFVFRQVSYRDSIIVPVTSTVFTELRLYLRLFERGELYWTSFAELQQSRNYEQFLKLMFFNRSESSLMVGAGGRWYALSQENLLQKNSGNTLTQSFGPECSVQYAINNASIVSLSGWYEFQFANHLHNRNVPNMSLNVRRNL